VAKLSGQKTRATGPTLASHGKPANYGRQSSYQASRTKIKSGAKA
jgi:hypothetical protein